MEDHTALLSPRDERERRVLEAESEFYDCAARYGFDSGEALAAEILWRQRRRAFLYPGVQFPRPTYPTRRP